MDDRWSVMLCGGCGYELAEPGDWSGVCPECGRSMVESSPAARTGSPWQVRPGVVAAVRTWWWVMRSPGRAFERVRVDGWGSAGLAVVYGGVGGALVWAGVAVSWSGGSFRGVMPLIGMVSLGVWLFGALTLLEYAGLRVIGGRRGWRVGHRVSASVVGHASVAWVMAGVLGAAGVLLGSVWPGGGRSVLSTGVVWDMPVLRLTYRAHRHPMWVLGFAGLFAGMLWFEVLAYIGLRRCRWANVGAAGGPAA